MLDSDREIDARIAVICGWKPEGIGDNGPYFWRKPNGWRLAAVMWHPSTSDADAFQALDAVLEKHPTCQVDIEIYSDHTVGVLIHDGRYYPLATGSGMTRPEAICAAIEALDKQEKKP